MGCLASVKGCVPLIHSLSLPFMPLEEVTEMKHGNEFYLQLTRKLFTEEYKNLSKNAKWLFIVLNELEQRYTGEKEDFFFRSNEDLATDCHMSLPTLKRAKKELLETNLVTCWQIHFVNKDTGKKSEKRTTAYKILK